MGEVYAKSGPGGWRKVVGGFLSQRSFRVGMSVMAGARHGVWPRACYHESVQHDGGFKGRLGDIKGGGNGAWHCC
jgi:hypothetical protein